MRFFSLFILLILLLPNSGCAKPQYVMTDAFPRLPAFSAPIEMVQPRDGTNRLFVVEQRGKIYLFDRNPNTATRKLFLDLSSKVSQSGAETGLLGLDFHPQYSSNGYFFVNYTSSAAGKLQSFVSRFQVSSTNPDSALRSSELNLITLDQPFENHNGGCVRFGPDGYLYLTFGDGGSGGDPNKNGQNKKVLLGKILRIDVNGSSGGRNYTIPPGNPFAGNTTGMREEIYAYGLRNPWKISFDRTTGKLWAGDVGQNLWEEVDTITAGGNYGWNIMEGKACYNPSSNCDTTGLIMPLLVYYHSEGNISITGGYVYRGNALSALQGKYVYGDYGSGNIWSLSFDGSGAPVNQLLVHASAFISAFGEDQEGEVYIVSYGNGRLLKLQQLGMSAESGYSSIPNTLILEQNYPNPFNPSTNVGFKVSRSGYVSLTIFDVLGRGIATLVNGDRPAGSYTVRWDASNVPGGVYFYRLTSGSSVLTRSMLLLR